MIDDNTILIIVPRYIPYKEKSYYEFPLGLAYISACLRQSGNNVDVLNLNHYEGDQINTIRDKIINNYENGGKYKYFLTGGLSAHYNTVKNIVKDIRNLILDLDLDQDYIIIIGGGLVTATPELMYNYIRPDYMVLGEGEITTVELINNLKSGNNIDSVKGIGYTNSFGKLVITPKREPITNLDSIPFPDTESFEFEKYLDMQAPNDNLYLYVSDHPRFYPIISSRGCPYNCTFCYHPLGQQYRSRSVDNFISEVKYAKERYNINNLAIFDELISADRKRLYKLCARLKELSVNWMCQLRVDMVDEEMLNVMKEAGCFIVSYGFESASDKILNSMNKHINKNDIETAMELTRKAGIGIQGYFIFGDIAETKETAYETLDFWNKHKDYHITMGYVRPYPGSELWKRSISKCSDIEQLEFLNKCVNSPPNLSQMNKDEWFGLQKDVQRAIITNDHFGKLISSCNINDNESITIQCPHCNQIITYNNFNQRILGVFKIACRNCNQPMNMTPLAFIDVRNDYESNIKTFETIRNEGVSIVVTPCMNDAEFAAMAETFLGVNSINRSNISIDRIVNYMDIDDSKIGKAYLGKVVLKRNVENCIDAYNKGYYFLIPLTRFANRIVSHLLSLGVDKNRICRLDEVIYDKFTMKDFANIFDNSIYNISNIREIVDNSDFRYRILSGNEKESVIIRVFNTLLSDDLKVSGPERKKDWETGWNENFIDYVNNDYNINNLIPRFVRKNNIARFRDQYILPLDPNFESNFVKILRYYLFSKYFSDVQNIYEFGCGTGLSLLTLNDIFPDKVLYGLDWSESSCKIINELAKKLNINNLIGILFDMFSPDPNYKLSTNSGILTIGAMEQLGINFHEFLNFLLKEKPSIIINVELNYESHDKNTLFGYVAATYIERRNYLRGFYSLLKELENQGKINILENKGTFGGLYHDGYSYIVWRIL